MTISCYPWHIRNCRVWGSICNSIEMKFGRHIVNTLNMNRVKFRNVSLIVLQNIDIWIQNSLNPRWFHRELRFMYLIAYILQHNQWNVLKLHKIHVEGIHYMPAKFHFNWVTNTAPNLTITDMQGVAAYSPFLNPIIHGLFALSHYSGEGGSNWSTAGNCTNVSAILMIGP